MASKSQWPKTAWVSDLSELNGRAFKTWKHPMYGRSQGTKVREDNSIKIAMTKS